MELKKIGIVVRGSDAEAHKLAAHFAEQCLAEGITPIISADSLGKIDDNLSVLSHNPALQTETLKTIGTEANVTIVLGGDGTYLAAAAGLYGTSCPVVGVNLGHLGFLTDVSSQAIGRLLADLRQDKFKPQKRCYYLATLYEDGKKSWQQQFLNDAVIQRNANERMIRLTVDVGQWRVANARADGLIVSTPTGSTAYNLSTGGPIMHPNIDALVLAPICPHNLAFRPVVMPPKDICITLKTPTGHLSIDGRKSHMMAQGDQVVIEKSDHMLHMLVHKNYNFFDVLRDKFGWDQTVRG